MSDIRRTKLEMIDYVCVDCKEVFDGHYIICPHCYSGSIIRAKSEIKKALRVPE